MKNLFWLLVGALITLLVPAVLSQPINNYFRGDRLVGTMKVADWQAQPAVNAPEKPANSEPASTEEILKDLEELAQATRDLASASTRESYAVLTLRNNSDKVVNNIRLKFDSYSADILLDKADDKLDEFQKDVKEITIPEMKQGDELIYRIWSTSSSPEYLKDDIQTFSSAGPVRMKYVFPESELETELSTFEWIIDELFPWLGAGLLVVFGVLGVVFASHYETLVKALLKDQNAYDEERSRYESDPEKYTPLTWAPKKTDGKSAT